MQSSRRKFDAMSFVLFLMLATAWPLRAQSRSAPYPDMAPIGQYRMARGTEITLARSAAPASISQDAEVLVLGSQGYETAVKGKNGFVCMVQRSWTAGFDDPEFWNPKLRAPICLNPEAVRSYLPINLRKTTLVLSGHSKSQIMDDLTSAFARKELPPLKSGAIGYMMSKDAYLSDHDGHWYPHLMLFVPQTNVADWGAGQPGSPILGFKDAAERLTVFLIPVGTWSDGKPAPLMEVNH